MHDDNSLLPQSQLSPLGVNIRRYREQNHLTQDALADLAGVSVSTLKRILSGQSPNLDTAIRLADALHVSLDDLVGRSSPTPAGAAEISQELISVYKARLEEKEQLIADQDETIRVQRRSNRRYQIFIMAVLAALLVVVLFDILNGNVGYVRYSTAVPAISDAVNALTRRV